jgi:energy-converting hydrogenase Eha subunit G
VTIGLAASLAAVLACAGVLLAARRRQPQEADIVDVIGRPVNGSSTRDLATLALIATGVAVLVTPFWGAAVLGIGSCELAARRWARPVRLLAVSGIAGAAYVAIAVAFIERRDAPFPGAGWTTSFEHLNGLALSAVALVAASALLAPVTDQSKMLPQSGQ